MVQGVDVLVKEWNVQKPVNPVEIKALPDRDKEKQRDEPDGICGPCQHRRIPIRQRPEHQHLISSPDRDTASQRPKHVVLDLSAQGELTSIFHQRARIIAQLFTLLGEGVEIQMQPTRHCDHQDQVADVHFRDPAKSERFGFFQWGLEPIERDASNAHNDHFFCDQKPRVPNPRKHFHRAQRPAEKR